MSSTRWTHGRPSMSGWLIVRAGSEAQRSRDGVAKGIDDDDAALDPDLLLLPRRLERLKVEDGDDNGTNQNPPFLRVLSWNTLADGLAQLGRFSRCPDSALAWPARRRLVLREIERSRADIACLQEINRPGDLEPPLREAGYDGAFWAKPVSPAARLGFPGDGSAVLWKRDRFELVSVVGKPFDAVAPPDASSAAAAAAAAASASASALGASTIAAPAAAATAAAAPTGGGGGGGGRRGVQGLLLVTLRDRRDRGRRVVVACVHLKAKEGAANDAARAAQAREAVRALEEEASRPDEEESAAEREREHEEDAEERRGRRQAGSGSGGGGDPPPATVAILAGDFNAEPGSAPHEAVRASGLPLRCLWECEREEDEGDGGEATAAEAASSGGSGGNGAPRAAAAKEKGSASNNRLPPYTTYKFRSEDSESDASDGTSRGGTGGESAERSDDKAATAKSGNSACTDQLCRRVSDFVFFTPRSASAVERWAPLDFERDVKDGLPCERYPSDHAAVLAVLRPK